MQAVSSVGTAGRIGSRTGGVALGAVRGELAATEPMPLGGSCPGGGTGLSRLTPRRAASKMSRAQETCAIASAAASCILAGNLSGCTSKELERKACQISGDGALEGVSKTCPVHRTVDRAKVLGAVPYYT